MLDWCSFSLGFWCFCTFIRFFGSSHLKFGNAILICWICRLWVILRSLVRVRNTLLCRFFISFVLVIIRSWIVWWLGFVFLHFLSFIFIDLKVYPFEWTSLPFFSNFWSIWHTDMFSKTFSFTGSIFPSFDSYFVLRYNQESILHFIFL